MRILLVAGLTLFVSSVALAQTGPALLLKPLLSEEETLEVSGDVLMLKEGQLDKTGLDTQLTIYETAGRFRENREKLIPRLGWELMYLDVDSNSPLLDKAFTDVSFAAGLEIGRYYDWQGALTVGVGYAGSAPFGEGDRGWYFKSTLLFGHKLDKKTDVAFVVDYDGNRAFYPDVPLPGFAYRHEFDPKLVYTLGLPFSGVTWKPFDPFSIDVSWTIWDSFDATAEYKLAPAWSIIANFETRLEGFYYEELPGKDRLLFRQRRAEMGVRWEPFDHTQLSAAVGYAFGSEFSSGRDHSSSDLIADLSDEPYIRFGFQSRF